MTDNHPAVVSFFQRMTFIPLAGVTLMLPEGRGGIKMHVVPIEKTIEIENESINIEKISYWLSKTVCYFYDIHLIRDHPRVSKIVKAKKLFPMLKYVMKRGVLIRTKSFSLEAKMMKMKKRIQKEIQDDEKKIRRTPVTA